MTATAARLPLAPVIAPTAPFPRPRLRPLPEPGPWAAALAKCCLEAIIGVRDVQQLSRWLTPRLFTALARRAGLTYRIRGAAAPGTQIFVLSHHVCSLDSDTHEVSISLSDGHRVRAVAVRVELFHSRWRATALEIG